MNVCKQVIEDFRQIGTLDEQCSLIRSFKRIRWSAHVTLFVSLYDHVERQVQLEIIDALGSMEGQEARDFLLRIVRHHEDQKFRWLAINSLTFMSLLHPADLDLYLWIIRSPRQYDFDCRETAYYGLTELGKWFPETRPALRVAWPSIESLVPEHRKVDFGTLEFPEDFDEMEP